jgi:hypothetical protein
MCVLFRVRGGCLSLCPQNILYRIGGAIPGPIVFGILLDHVCSARQQHCGGDSVCLYYNSFNLALVTASVGIVCKVLATLAYWCAYKSFVSVERRPAVTLAPVNSELLSKAIEEYGAVNRASVVSVPDEVMAMTNGTSDTARVEYDACAASVSHHEGRGTDGMSQGEIR